MPKRKKENYKFCCLTLEDVIEGYSGTIEMNSSIMDFSKGDFNPPHPVMRLYGLTENGNPSFASSKSSWVSLFYCPICGTHLANSVAIGRHKKTKKYVVLVNGEHDQEFDTEEEAIEFSNTIPKVIER